MLLDGYIRVSKVAGRSGPSFISPIVQREEIERWAAAQGVVIGQVFEELDESGARSDRPLLLEAIRRVESRETDGVVVAYLSRFGRSLFDAMVAIKRITEAGGTFVSVQEGLDLSTDTGRLVLRMLFSIAEWERDRNRTYLEEATERAVARGVRMGTIPFGYRRGDDGRLERHPEYAPLVAELFRRRAAGVAVNELRHWLIASGVRPEKKKRYWYGVAVHLLLQRRVYRGELHFGRFVNLHAHPPLVDEDTWQKAQTRNLRVPAQHSREPLLLRGLVRCAGCQRKMHMASEYAGSSVATRVYACPDRLDRCRAPAYISDAVVEPYVEVVFWQELPRRRRTHAGRRTRRLDQLVERRHQELSSYRDNARLPRTLGDDRFADGLAVRVRRLEQARLEASQARAAADESSLPESAELAKRWSTMSVNDRRLAIADVIDCVFVSKPGRPIEDRLFVCLHGRGPALVSPDPKDTSPATPFDPGACPAGAKLRERKREVDPAELERELRTFLEGETFWPAFRHFQAHGRAALYVDAKRNGGLKHWSHQLDLPYKPPRDMHSWTEDRIRNELGRYLRGKTRWPTTKAFNADGEWRLRDAVRWNGGPERWAAEMGVTLDARRRSHKA